MKGEIEIFGAFGVHGPLRSATRIMVTKQTSFASLNRFTVRRTLSLTLIDCVRLSNRSLDGSDQCTPPPPPRLRLSRYFRSFLKTLPSLSTNRDHIRLPATLDRVSAAPGWPAPRRLRATAFGATLYEMEGLEIRRLTITIVCRRNAARRQSTYCYENDVHPSVYPSVRSVHCAKTVQDEPIICMEVE